MPLLMALACVLAIGAALLAQYGFDMRPCPWCILQRLIFIVIALLLRISPKAKFAVELLDFLEQTEPGTVSLTPRK